MFEGFFGKKEKISLLVDIGNGSVAVALALYSDNEKPKILYTIRKSFNIFDIPDDQKTVENMFSLLEEIFKKILEDKIVKRNNFSNVLVSFSSPWAITRTRIVNISQDRAFIITKQFIDEVISKEEVIFIKELKEITTENVDVNSAVVLDKIMVSSKLNGYVLENNIGNKTKIFDASICFSAINKNLATNVISIINKYFGVSEERISMHSFSLISFFVIKDIFIMDKNFIVMDITGDTTELTLVEDGVLTKCIYFPSGKNFIIRQIAKKLNISNEISESMFHVYSMEKINEEERTKIFEVLANIEKEWSVYLEDALLDLSQNKALPSKIFLTVDNDVATFYTDCIKLSKNDSISSFRKNANVIHINNEIISHIYNTDSRMINDEFIGLLTIFNGMSQK
jgi:cell division ATPase FtsA